MFGGFIKMRKENYLTTKEAAEKLNVTVTTIYNYVKRGRLKPVYDDWSIDGMMLFYEEDIENLKEERPQGYTTGQVATILGMHQTTISKQIKEGKIKAKKVLYKGRMTYFVDEDTLNELITLREKKRNNYIKIFDSNYQLYLFQSLVNDRTNEFGRIMDLSKDKGYLLTDSGREIALENLTKYGFSPLERYSPSKYLNRAGYVYFRFKKPTNLHDKTYDVLETFYRTAGYRNIKISLTDSSINVQIKPVLLEGKISIEDYLNDHIIQGSVVKRHNGIWLDSDMERFTIEMPRELKEKLKALARRKALTLEELILETLMDSTEDGGVYDELQGRKK